MPLAEPFRRAGFPTARVLIAALTLVVSLPAQAALPPPSVRLPVLFGRSAWHRSDIELPAPPWTLVRTEGARDAG